jgi:hypothetical protein
MQRRIVGYDVDESGERVAILDCGHPQHIRHNPPFTNRPWTTTEEGCSSMLGKPLNCVRCEEAGQAGDLWLALQLGDALMADSQLHQIEEEFLPVFDAAGQPADMAILKRHDTEHSLQCEVTVYFSPAAGAVGRAFGARPCARPSCTNLDLLAGDADCWAVLFSG